MLRRGSTMPRRVNANDLYTEVVVETKIDTAPVPNVGRRVVLAMKCVPWVCVFKKWKLDLVMDIFLDGFTTGKRDGAKSLFMVDVKATTTISCPFRNAREAVLWEILEMYAIWKQIQVFVKVFFPDGTMTRKQEIVWSLLMEDVMEMETTLQQDRNV